MFCALRGLVLAWLHLLVLGFVWMNHLWDAPPWCWCAWYTLFSTLCDVDMLALLALRHSFCFLCFIASLHACLHFHAWVCVLSILQSNGTMDTSIQTYICPPRTPPFVWYYVCLPLYVLHMFVCPYLTSFPSLSLACFSFHLFLCLFPSLFTYLLHVHAWSKDAWNEGITS